MNLHITKSKKAESFYIPKSFVKSNRSSTSSIVRKRGALNELISLHDPTREDVVAWAKNEARIETDKFKLEQQ